MARKRKTQVAKVRDFLTTGKKLTSRTAITRFGVYRLASIIHQLRTVFGMNIVTDNSKGYATYFVSTK